MANSITILYFPVSTFHVNVSVNLSGICISGLCDENGFKYRCENSTDSMSRNLTCQPTTLYNLFKAA